MRTITHDEVMTNITMYTVGMRHLGGELPCADGIYDPDGDMGRVDEHLTLNEVGTVEDEAVHVDQVCSSVSGSRVLHQWDMGVRTPAQRKTTTQLVAKDVTVDGVHYPRWYITD